MSPFLEVEASLDISEVDGALQRIVRRLGSFRQPLEEAGQHMQRSIDQNFRAGGRPRWKPHSPATLARRKAAGLTPIRLLEARGDLRASATQRNTKGSVWRLRSTSLETGTRLPHATAQQYGRRAMSNVRQRVRSHTRQTQSGRRSRVRAHSRTVTLPAIPARPFVGFQVPQDVDAVGQIHLKYAFDEPLRPGRV